MQIVQEVWPLGPGLQNESFGGFRCLCVKTEASVKREGSVTIASAALCLASPSKDDTD
jgi:hypothetical protein